MIRSRGARVVRHVARRADGVCARQAVVAVYVAPGAGRRLMQTRQCKASGRVVESSVTPVRGGVTLVASLREPRGHVVRSRRALEILQVALDARPARQVIGVVYVAR